MNSTDRLQAEQRAYERLAKEKRIAELVEMEKRAAEKAENERNPPLSRVSTKTADTKTVTMLMTIVSTVVLSLLALLFIQYYSTNRTAVIVISCAYIAVYGAFVMYVTNQVAEDDCFKDRTLTRVLKISTILVLFLAIMIALATLVMPLFVKEKPKDAAPSNGPRMVRALDINGNPVVGADGQPVFVPASNNSGQQQRQGNNRYNGSNGSNGNSPSRGNRRNGRGAQNPGQGGRRIIGYKTNGDPIYSQ